MLNSRADIVYRKYVISLTPGEKARLAELISNDLLASKAVESGRSIVELHGLGREVWDSIDAQEYIDQLRDEWDQPK